MDSASTPRKQRSLVAGLLSGVLGGLVVLVAGAVLISTDVIDTGDTEQVVRQAPIARPAADDSEQEGGRTVQDIYREEGRGVAFVEAQGVSDQDPIFGTPQQGSATGSGFVVDEDGTILTNAHVVAGSDDVTVSFEQGGDAIAAEVKGRDPDSDLAVLKIDPSEVEDLTALPLGDSSEIAVGDPVVAIGNPFGFTRTVTTGIVSALQRQIEAPTGFSITDVIQTDASINPGNSGGPLLDGQGRVIGINSQIATGGGQGSVGIGFAVPINKAKELLPRLREGGDIEHAYLGVRMATVGGRLAEDFNLPVDEGALVQRVTDGSPADEAGLRAGGTETADGFTVGGDLIVKVGGTRVRDADDVVAAVDRHEPGDEIEIEYYRGDERRTVEVKLAERPDDADAIPQSGEQAPQDEGEELLPLP